MPQMASWASLFASLLFLCCLPVEGFVSPDLAGNALGSEKSKLARNSGRAVGVQGLRATVSQDIKGQDRLKKFLEDCAFLGPVRFVSMSEGAAVEFVGDFDNIRYNDLPKGRYATIVDDEDGLWEVHVNMDRVAGIQMVTQPAKSGGYDLYITRLVDDKGATLLSTMLHGKGGAYEDGAVTYWEKLQAAFGRDQKLV